MDIDKRPPDPENDLTPLERRLTAWQPAAGGLNRDHVLYSAGRASALAEARARLWKLATAASLLAAATLGTLLARERSQRTALEGPTTIQTNRPTSELLVVSSHQLALIETPGPNSYLVLSSRLAAKGPDPSLFDAGLDTDTPKHPSASIKSSPSFEPLRPRDLEQALEL